ncbi:MAG: hypothetical protein QNL88_06345 [Acidobacteriota bacterium]|nr:hypothetical protein [Acidobacteriota bacterium]
MRRVEFFRAFAIVALLLPGLVFAAPTAGSCGLCDRGVPCAGMSTPEPTTTNHSCCGEAATEAPTAPTTSSLSSKACDCGREAPLAVTVAPSPGTDVGAANVANDGNVSTGVTPRIAFAACDRHPPPLPSPLIFLIDCVSLT